MDDLRVHPVGSLDMPDAGDDSDGQEDEQHRQARHHDVDAVPVLDLVLDLDLLSLFPGAHFLSSLTAGFSGSATSDPSSFSRFTVVDALCSRTSSASFSA